MRVLVFGVTAACCWHCGAGPLAAGMLECPGCGRLQPFPEGVDYFAVMGLDRRLQVDTAALRDCFYALSRRLHPDRFAESSEKERAISTANAAVLNQAYRALRDPLARAAYVVARAGDGKSAAPDARPQDPALLMEMMEIQEALEEARAGDVTRRGELEATRQDFQSRQAALDRDLEDVFAAWDASVHGSPSASEATLLDRLRQNLAVRKFYANIVRDIGQVLGE